MALFSLPLLLPLRPFLYIYCDRDQMVWTSCSSASGIYQIIPASIPVLHYTGDTSQPHHLFNGTAINRIAVGSHGKLWIGVGDDLPDTVVLAEIVDKCADGFGGDYRATRTTAARR